MDRPEDTVEHTVKVCPAWAEHRRVLQEVIGCGDLSGPALVEAMVRGDAEAWETAEFQWAPDTTPEGHTLRLRDGLRPP